MMRSVIISLDQSRPAYLKGEGEAGRGFSFLAPSPGGEGEDSEGERSRSFFAPRKRLFATANFRMGLHKVPDGLGAIRKVRLLPPPIVDLGNKVVVNPHLKGSVPSAARRPSNYFFRHVCNFGIDRHDACVYHNFRLGKCQNQTAPQDVRTILQGLTTETCWRGSNG